MRRTRLEHRQGANRENSCATARAHSPAADACPNIARVDCLESVISHQPTTKDVFPRLRRWHLARLSCVPCSPKTLRRLRDRFLPPKILVKISQEDTAWDTPLHAARTPPCSSPGSCPDARQEANSPRSSAHWGHHLPRQFQEQVTGSFLYTAATNPAAEDLVFTAVAGCFSAATSGYQ